MPQRSSRTEKYDVFDWRRFDLQKFSPTEQRALTRIGYDKTMGDEINWFIRLAKTDLGNASEGDVLLLQEDISALAKARCDFANPPLPTREQIAEIQHLVQKSLEELADQGWTLFPETPIQLYLGYPRRQVRLHAKTTDETVYLPSDIPDCTSQDTIARYSFADLVYYMGQLLEKVGNCILRCPHCQSIFLQSRRNQDYCGRSCQSVAVMQRRRAQAKAQTTKKATAKKSISRKGGTRDGKKRR